MQFEKDLGLRPLLLGNLDQCIETYTTKIGAALVSKFTFPAPDASVKTEDRTVEGIKIRIYTPENYTGNKPICVFTHGGGWCMGDLDVEDANCRTIASGGGVKVVSMDYRLGPQHPFPAGFDDCVKITEWVLEYGSSLNATPGKILLAGVSAGGGICLTVALKLIDQGRGDVLQGVIAQVPATLHADAVPEELKSGYKSFKEHSRHTVNSDEAMYAFWSKLFFHQVGKYFVANESSKMDLGQVQLRNMPIHYSIQRLERSPKHILPSADMIPWQMMPDYLQRNSRRTGMVFISSTILNRNG